jgi:hypothetical protein
MKITTRMFNEEFLDAQQNLDPNFVPLQMTPQKTDKKSSAKKPVTVLEPDAFDEARFKRL